MCNLPCCPVSDFIRMPAISRLSRTIDCSPCSFTRPRADMGTVFFICQLHHSPQICPENVTALHHTLSSVPRVSCHVPAYVFSTFYSFPGTSGTRFTMIQVSPQEKRKGPAAGVMCPQSGQFLSFASVFVPEMIRKTVWGITANTGIIQKSIPIFGISCLAVCVQAFFAYIPSLCRRFPG